MPAAVAFEAYEVSFTERTPTTLRPIFPTQTRTSSLVQWACSILDERTSTPRLGDSVEQTGEGEEDDLIDQLLGGGSVVAAGAVGVGVSGAVLAGVGISAYFAAAASVPIGASIPVSAVATPVMFAALPVAGILAMGFAAVSISVQIGIGLGQGKDFDDAVFDVIGYKDEIYGPNTRYSLESNRKKAPNKHHRQGPDLPGIEASKEPHADVRLTGTPLFVAPSLLTTKLAIAP